MSDVGGCESCGAPIVWTMTPAGARAPIDAEPDKEKGNVLLLRQSHLGVLAIVLSGETLELARRAGIGLRFNHWATCPDRREWREKTDAKRETAGAGASDRG